MKLMQKILQQSINKVKKSKLALDVLTKSYHDSENFTAAMLKFAGYCCLQTDL